MTAPGLISLTSFFSTPKLALALSGGGSWGAFTAGSLDALIEAGIIKDKNLAAISGTSAGAFNGSLLSYAANTGDVKKARGYLTQAWDMVVRYGERAGLNMMPTALGEKFPNLNADLLKQSKKALKFWQDWGIASQPGALRQQIEAVIGNDWRAIQQGRVKTYIGTVQLSQDRHRRDIKEHKTFDNKDITPAVVAASGTLIGKTQIANDYYVDGAYMKNPSMDELDTGEITDIIAIVLYPEPKGAITPAHEDDIQPTKTEFIGPEVYQHLAWLTEHTDKRVHVIAMPHENHWNETSKMNISREWVSQLYDLGYEETKKWIAKNGSKIGKESTFKPQIACDSAPCPSCSTLECEMA